MFIYNILGTHLKSLFCVLIIIFSSNLFAGISNPLGVDDRYVRVVDGHLHKNGKRLRLWGVNIQSGVFKSYLEIDRLVKRLKALGFNAVRLWPTQGTFYSVRNGQLLFNISSKGSGLDRFDYLVAKLSNSGFSIHMTMLHYRHTSEFVHVDSSFIQNIFSRVDDSTKRLLIGILPYISSDYKKLYLEHISSVLSRVNPYTQKKYSFEKSISTWELANESRFVYCLTTDSCLSKLPVAVIRLVSLAWKNSSYNPYSKPIPTNIDIAPYSSLKTQYKKFVVQKFIEESKEFERYSRNVGGIGSGVWQQPFLYNTGPISPSLMSQKAYGAGDVFSLAGYHSPLVKEGNTQRVWLPISEGGTGVPYLDLKMNNKPFIIYETSFFRPYPYRAEWGIVLAALALQQDWDGVFLYIYGQPWAIYADSGRDTGYGYKPLPIPKIGDGGVRGDYFFGFHQGGDPVSMASWSLASGLFLGAESIGNSRKVVWDISEDEVYSGRGYPRELMSSKKKLVKEGGVSINFIKGNPVCVPCFSDNASLGTNYVRYDSTRKRLTVKTKGGKALVGQLSGDLGEIYPGIRARVVKPGFGLIGVIPMEDGVFRLFSIKNVKNKGFQFNPNLVNFKSPAGAMNGVVSSGRLPLEYEPLGVVFSIDKSFKSIKEFDFGFDLLTSTTGEGLKEILPNAKTFYMELKQ